MAKDKSESEIREKKEKKEKKRKREEGATEDGEPTPKKDKKDKKKRKSEAADESVLDINGAPSLANAKLDADDDDDEKKVALAGSVPLAALVPFANPLADDKSQKKVLKAVKKAAKHKALKRGVKECVKSIRKSGPVSAIPSTSALPAGIVILAADISPMDVISHIPVLCEDHQLPYLYVPSRAELGAAGSTKRPTSVVMLTPAASAAGNKKKAAADADASATAADDEWSETYRDLWKLAIKLGQTVKV